MRRAWWLFAVLVLVGIAYVAHAGQKAADPHQYKVTKSDAEWRKKLSPEAYRVLRQAGTEAPGSSQLDHWFTKGTYVCAGCGLPLFSSDAKFDSGTGWPSFWQPIKKGAVILQPDHSLGMDRNEVLCSRCGGHLGHVFDDGPKPTGLRYCMNGVALDFQGKAKH